MADKYENLIVGSGLSGAILANLIAQNLDEKVLVIDKRSHIAGNIYDYKDKDTNITVQKYGPHIFHTNDSEVFNYLSKFTKWNYFFFKPKVIIEGNAVTLPFNLNTLYDVFSQSTAKKFEEKLLSKYSYGSKVPIVNLKQENDEDLKFIADYIFNNVFKNYTLKQWGGGGR